MAVSVGSSSIATNGLVLYLDPSVSTNYVLTEVEVLVVAGGGSGGTGSNGGGGGGAGGLIYRTSYPVTTGVGITVVIGNGGSSTVGRGVGSNGQNSVFGNITATGGGAGGGSGGSSAGLAGGSGGGGMYSNNGGSGANGQGNTGGTGNYVLNGPHDAGGGGGGASQRGEDANEDYAGRGGNGLCFSLTGTPRYYAGGGGGASNNISGGGLRRAGAGGLGGGGRGGVNGVTLIGQSGEANTGGGGGGGVGASGGASGAGGSGVVIVRYPGPQKATGGNTITQINGYTVHVFTGSGAFTPTAAPANGGGINGLQDLANNNNFTISSVNSPTFAQTTNNSVLLNGTNQYFTFGNALGNDFNEITVSAWVRPTTFPGGNYTSESLVSCDDGSSPAPNSCFALTIQHHNSPAEIPASFTGNLIAFGVRTKLDPYNFRPISIAQNSIWDQYLGGMAFSKDPAEYALNTWMHLVGTYNGSVTLIYINGVLKGSSNSQPDGVNRSVSGSLNNTLLGRTIGSYAGGGLYFTGNIGPVAIHSKALTASEVQQNFNAQRGRFGI